MSNKKDKKRFYCKNQTQMNKRFEELTETLSGVLITTDKNKEKNAVRDAYNILNDAVEHIYPDLDIPEAEVEIAPKKKQKVSETESKVVNISELLEEEINSLKKKTKLFYNFDTNCKGVVFIKLEKSVKDKIDITRVVEYIISNLKSTKQQVSKNIARFIPVEMATKAKYENFIKLAPTVLDKYFKTEEEGGSADKVTWKLEFKVRNNNSIHKDEYLNFVWNYIDKNKYAVDYKEPKYTVLVEITNDVLCMSVLEGYFEKKCYNLLTLSKSDEELQLERERLIGKQKEAEQRKLENANKVAEGDNKEEDKLDNTEDNNIVEEAKEADNDITEEDEEDIQII
jgi:tRNA acetyltransferase TAN1